MASEQALQRLDLAVCRARKDERGARDGPQGVAAAAPAHKEPFASRNALIERPEPTLEDWLVSDDPGRDGDAEIARDLGLSAATVTNHLAAMRRQFRAIVLERLRELTSSEEEWEAEAARLLGR